MLGSFNTVWRALFEMAPCCITRRVGDLGDDAKSWVMNNTACSYAAAGADQLQIGPVCESSAVVGSSAINNFG